MQDVKNKRAQSSLLLSLVALNLAIGGLVSFMKLPVYLDSTGIVLATLLLGPGWGVLCALLTVGIGFFVINPYLPAYVGTSILIAITVSTLRRFNMFANRWRAVGSGLVVAIVAATASAPVTAILFEGATLSGNDALTALFLKTGKGVLTSVFLSGFSSEPIDKILVCLISFQVLIALPQGFLRSYGLQSFRDAS